MTGVEPATSRITISFILASEMAQFLIFGRFPTILSKEDENDSQQTPHLGPISPGIVSWNCPRCSLGVLVPTFGLLDGNQPLSYS